MNITILQTVVSGIPLTWAPERECRILLFVWSLGGAYPNTAGVSLYSPPWLRPECFVSLKAEVNELPSILLASPKARGPKRLFPTIGGSFLGCPYKKSPSIEGLYWGG